MTLYHAIIISSTEYEERVTEDIDQAESWEMTLRYRGFTPQSHGNIHGTHYLVVYEKR